MMKSSHESIIKESLSIEEENIIKDIRNIFRLKKEIETIKDRMLRDIFFEQRIIFINQ